MSRGIPAGGPFRAAMGLHESLTPEAVREARRSLASYCSDPKMCEHYVRLLEEVSRLTAKVRIHDLAWDERYEGLDAPVMNVLRRLASFYSKLLAGYVAGQSDSVVVVAVKRHRGDDIDLEKGDVAVLDIATAASLAAAGIVEPSESNALKLLAGRRAPGGVQGGG